MTRKAAVSMLSGMAYESMTTTGETTISAWPTVIADYVRRRAFFPVPCPIHPSALKTNSRKSSYTIVHRTPPQNRKARSPAHPHSVTDFSVLWYWIDIRDHDGSPATVDLDRTMHVSCVALHTPVSGVASPTPCTCHRQCFGS
jgi:hypothetical protein